MVCPVMTLPRAEWADQQRATVAVLRERVAVLETENEALRAKIDRLQARIRVLLARVEELRRAGKRQAAPFSKNKRNTNPKRPGRKPGGAYGRHARRPVPNRVDRVVGVPLPSRCPHCGGEVIFERLACQHQEDLPPPQSTQITRYELRVGRCRNCRRRVQPRHPEQTSDALGAAGVQIGPRAVALAAWLSKGLGLPAAKVARVLGQSGLSVTPGGVIRALARAARRATPTWDALVGGVKASPVVAPDETGWRVGGGKAWLWAFVGHRVIVYRIAHGRGFDDAAAVLGEGYAGVLERDGWAPYRRFTNATHQSCLAHLLRRCRELIDDAERGQAKTPHAIRRILQGALAVRGARTAYPPNRRLLRHLATERDALFTFLFHDGVQATNWRAEQAIRPAVVTRKTWGGNRTWTGAGTWQVLASVTATVQDRDPVGLLIGLLRAPGPVLADLAIPTTARGP